MGGNLASKSKESTHFKLYLKTLQNDKKKYLAARTLSQDRSEGSYCLKIANVVSAIFSNEEKRVVYNTKWKTNLIQQLSNLKNEDWPVILSTFLKSWNQDSVDLKYQSQISWIDFNNTRSTKLNSSQIAEYQTTNPESATRKISSGQIIVANQKEKDNEVDEEHKINEMLNQTPILEESFFAAHSRASMLQKSFVTSAKHNISQIHSADSGTVQSNSEEEEKKSSPTRVQDQNTTIDLYKGSTFLNHIPVTLSKVTLGIPDPNKASSNMHLIQSIHNYKLITALIEKDLQSPWNVFHQLINKFTEFFVTKYEKVIDGFHNKTISKAEISTNTSHAVIDLQQFIRLLYESMNSFYKLDSLKMGEAAKENIFNRDNMLNFITSLVFNERIYSNIFEILRIKDINIEIAFLKNVEPCSTKAPEYLGIAPEFCLNERTLEYYFGDVETAFNNLIDEPITKRAGAKIAKNFTLDIIEADQENSSSLNINRSSSQNSDVIGVSVSPANTLDRQNNDSRVLYAKKLLKSPYKTCMNVLKKIEQQRSPIHKMKAIVKTAELINTSIQNFYKTFKIKKSFKLDADQTLSILMYIVSRADVKSLATHIKSIEKFATNNALNSISGYYATTLEACVNCITNMEFSEDNSGENFLDNLKSVS